jgi:hypothetical protein
MPDEKRHLVITPNNLGFSVITPTATWPFTSILIRRGRACR